ncbi:hypothetical protein GGR51DRAFT_569998 [Nemania sp. FL0031]|nr:hypothetical protein GGR51DRAFT_569998 [Nemania sp. FL0031]
MAPSQPCVNSVDIIEELDFPNVIIPPRANTSSPPAQGFIEPPEPSKSGNDEQKHQGSKRFNKHVADTDWTRRHEKVLHVAWQSFQPPPYQISQSQLLCGKLPCDHHQGPSDYQKHIRDVEYTLWLNRHRGGVSRRWSDQLRDDERWEEEEQEEQLEYSSRLTLPSLPFSFELINEDQEKITNSIASLQKKDGMIRHARQLKAMKILLSGVDQEDTLQILDRLSPSQKFLRVEEANVRIAYGREEFHFLSEVPVYRMDTMPSETTDGIDDHHQCPTVPNTEGFWRMMHLDYTHIFEALHLHRTYGANFRIYGVRRGMSKYEYMERYEFEYGEGEWNQPHFIPGVFIAMAQRYRRKGRFGQGGTGNNVAPTRQILLTDGPNDWHHAHLYTTQVPDFLLSSFDKPTEMHLPLPPISNQKESIIKNGRQNEEELEEVPFDFPIRHTIIPYCPQDTFRERLREVIMLSRDSFRNTTNTHNVPSKTMSHSPIHSLQIDERHVGMIRKIVGRMNV